jgi:hypothetical protein
VQRGQYATMTSAFSWLGFGLVAAIVLIYLLMVVNFQSWLDPFVIITALPGAISGIVWILFVTGTTLSVPALIGAIMCMGVATASSVWSSLAPERLAATSDARPPRSRRAGPLPARADDGARDGHRHRRWRAAAARADARRKDRDRRPDVPPSRRCCSCRWSSAWSTAAGAARSRARSSGKDIPEPSSPRTKRNVLMRSPPSRWWASGSPAGLA